MTKKHFIELADEIRAHNKVAKHRPEFPAFTDDHLHTLANVCAAANPRFNRERWLAYVAGAGGPNGRKTKPSMSERYPGGCCVHCGELDTDCDCPDGPAGGTKRTIRFTPEAKARIAARFEGEDNA